MSRQRRVRYSYPRAMMDLAVALSLQRGISAAAQTMSLPLSTIYRWLAQHRKAPEGNARVQRIGRGEGLGELIVVCEARGFNVRRAAALLNRSDLSAHDVGNRFEEIPHALGAPAPQRPDERSRPGDRGSQVPAQARGRLELARRIIETCYYSKLSCEALANAAAMSRWHFIKLFKSAFAVSPYHYLMQVRIRQAKHILQTTSQPIDAVATAVGFDTTSSLCKAFRSVEGASLSSFYHGIRIGYIPMRQQLHATQSAQRLRGADRGV